ncbi:MAG: hypothetical protein HETSPECPRED_006397 [Heterodermia speciosa]|uniref:Uncharacterized protein n=1 Tax=Heterodermia speciosa TaxID=116794 RepID=A0A8H3FKC6_9LECA|nr:MAG: hypothetical protein HETSPECPRED_006397 [Heterodermia speciosa]
MVNGQAPAMKTTFAIEKAISETGMDYGNTMYSIRRYARRNEVMHSMVSVFIKNCQWEALALQISRDIKDLPSVFGDTEYKNMRQVLHSMRDRYFLSVENPAEPILTDLAVKRWMDRQREMRQKPVNRQRDEKGQESEANEER